MRVKHKLGNKVISKQADKEASFMLTNNVGGYALLGEEPSSRYQGVYMFDKTMHKVIEEIKLLNTGPTTELTNELSKVTRKKGAYQETFFMPNAKNALVYELNKEGEVEITLDARGSYENPEFGRDYEIIQTEYGLLITYRHQKEKSYTALRFSGRHELIKEWTKQTYENDKKRNSFPYEKYVYKAAILMTKKIVFGYAKTKKQAEKLAAGNYKPTAAKGKNIAAACAQNSLQGLATEEGILAGLPWFFQYWSRDELISLKAINNKKLKKKILLKNLQMVKEGRLQNINTSKTTNADGIGWLFFRIREHIKLFDDKEKKLIKKKLRETIRWTKEKYTDKEGLVHNGPKETWMDTEWEKDNREGNRIEIQTLYLNMLRLCSEMTGKGKEEEEEFRHQVRKKFWNHKTLTDGYNDATIRPNIFIAAYTYPELLTKEEWTTCIENSLPYLWLEWGGLSSIEKDNRLFVDTSTGESVQSYHRGDSWYWINNMAAIVMKRIDEKRFRQYIEAIKTASTEEILFSGAIGHHAEISSAKKMESAGCLAQAWSNALFLELTES